MKINKTAVEMPNILTAIGKGQRATEALKTRFDAGERAFKTHDFDGSIYRHETVKTCLKTLQHDKCCFCEAKISHISHGDVEHFRPKAGYQVDETSPLIKPGYYWLAYNFDNLFLACQVCNQVYKKSYFPLSDEAARAKSHRDDHWQEESLIIHPEHDNPVQHLTFSGEVIKPVNQSRKGAETIKRTGLDRKELTNERLEHLKKLRFLAVVLRTGLSQSPTDTDLIRAAFKEWGQAHSLYSAMVRANFPDLV
jgi:uncharacterized protein (TIGR02646 family)